MSKILQNSQLFPLWPFLSNDMFLSCTVYAYLLKKLHKTYIPILDLCTKVLILLEGTRNVVPVNTQTRSENQNKINKCKAIERNILSNVSHKAKLCFGIRI